MRFIIKLICRLLWRVEVKGLENYFAAKKSSKPLLIVANHTSFLDGLFIDLFLPNSTTFLIHKEHTSGWKGWILKFANFIEVDMHSPLAAKAMVKILQSGKQGMIFPEGRITTTGGLMKVYSGAAWVADKTQAQILPVHISGAEFSKMSYLDGRFKWVKRSWFPKITLTLNPPTQLETDNPKRLEGLQDELYNLMRLSSFQAQFKQESLSQALFKLDKKHGLVRDSLGTELSIKKLHQATKVLGGFLDRKLEQENIGLLLPNVAGLTATFFALQLINRPVALINYSAGRGVIEQSLHTADVKQILSSRAFIEKAGLEKLAEELSQKFDLIYLEDLRPQIGLFFKLRMLIKPLKSFAGYQADPNNPAVLLFTSGSEGSPKVVVLSHNNLLANIAQINSSFSLLPNDGVFNALPAFHSFGLTAGILWPIFKNANLELHTSPLDYKEIPERIYQSNPRIFFATDSFYQGYAHNANPMDFYSLEVLVAGAEKLQETTRRLYADKFHKTIFEGYGVTEASPVVSVNLPQKFEHGTVGQLMPGIEYKIQPVEDLAEGGELWIKGPNIMLGYIYPENPGKLVILKDGWYATGDLIKLDSKNFIHILGRAKRFAKIAGEMVSLSAIESAITNYNNSGISVVCRQEHKTRGESLVVVTTNTQLSKALLTAAIEQAGLSKLAIPQQIIYTDEIPLLGNGKINYPAVDLIALNNKNNN